MSEEYRKGSHTVYDIQYHFVWVTKYRYHMLRGEVALRARELIRQICEARNMTILGGHVSKDHVHLDLSCPPEIAPSKVDNILRGGVQGLSNKSSPICASGTGENVFGRAAIFVRR